MSLQEKIKARRFSLVMTSLITVFFVVIFGIDVAMMRHPLIPATVNACAALVNGYLTRYNWRKLQQLKAIAR